MKISWWSAAAVTSAFGGILVLCSNNVRGQNIATPPPTYDKDVAPILFNHCATCHRAGQVAPFPLLTYKDAAKRASLIADVTESRYMPPWKPVHSYGEFNGANYLSDAEMATLRNWGAAKAPEGNASDLPTAPQFPDGWQLGKPDLIVKMAEPFHIPADGEDIYQCFVLPLGLTNGANVAAVEIHPGNPKVLHHSILYLNADGNAREKDKETPEPGYRCFGGPGVKAAGSLGGWVPGAKPHLLPTGTATYVPQAADVVMQNHYHPSGKPEIDQSELGIYFAKGSVEKTVFSIPMIHRDLNIPAGDSSYQVTSTFVTPIDLEVIAISPHMHLLGQDMKVTAKLPSGQVKSMIWIKDWDFNWQGQYQYHLPLTLPKGTKIELQATYDNSSQNPKNPNAPPQTVHWGESTTDEMCIAFIQVETRNPADRFTVLLSLADQLDLMRYREAKNKNLSGPIQ
jgi:mono/diheme cytochrome c family protein